MPVANLDEKTCPQCAGVVESVASNCRHCGQRLTHRKIVTKLCQFCSKSIPATASGCRYCRRTQPEQKSRLHPLKEALDYWRTWFLPDWLGRSRLRPRSDPEALTAYLDYEDREEEQPLIDPELSELEIYNVYRDYMKHEDDLLGTRLNSFLTVNTFLIAASVVILGGIIQLLTKDDIAPQRVLLLVVGGAVVHSMIAFVGYKSAELTRSSLMAATESLAFVRDRGNYRLRSAISRGDFPYLSNGRGLSAKERATLDRGFGIMREIPKRMKLFWLIIFIIPMPIIGASWVSLAKCPKWDKNAPSEREINGWLWRPALCEKEPDKAVKKLQVKPGTVIEMIN